MQKGTINGASDDLNGKAVGAQDGLNSKKLPDSVWEAIFDSIPDLVTVIDKDCRIVRMNKAMAERLGGSEEAFIGRACYETFMVFTILTRAVRM
jgi:PAS domain-containing protein